MLVIRVVLLHTERFVESFPSPTVCIYRSAATRYSIPVHKNDNGGKNSHFIIKIWSLPLVDFPSTSLPLLSLYKAKENLKGPSNVRRSSIRKPGFCQCDQICWKTAQLADFWACWRTFGIYHFYIIIN